MPKAKNQEENYSQDTLVSSRSCLFAFLSLCCATNGTEEFYVERGETQLAAVGHYNPTLTSIKEGKNEEELPPKLNHKFT